MRPRAILDDLARAVDTLAFAPPVTHVYNPLVYAREPASLYIERYGQHNREALLLGMNPGPFGMAQTGIPFGEVVTARDWLGVEAPVDKPLLEHPKRPVDGFACTRSEVSGARLWGWARDTFGTPQRFFARFFVWNYCPLAFMEDSGKNRTPDKLPAGERDPLFAVCDAALVRWIAHLRPRYVIGVGAFAEQRIRTVVNSGDIVVGRVPHPSPASPAANRGWADAATAALHDLGIRV